MRNGKLISQTIEELEKTLAVCNFIKESFPDAKFHNNGYYKGFSSKLVNSKYTNFDFVKNSSALYVIPYTEISFKYKGNHELLRINSSPRSSALVRAYYSYGHNQWVIKFPNFRLNFKKNNFEEKMIIDCRNKIVEFIGEHKNYKLIDKNLDPKIKKLLAFM